MHEIEKRKLRYEDIEQYITHHEGQSEVDYMGLTVAFVEYAERAWSDIERKDSFNPLQIFNIFRNIREGRIYNKYARQLDVLNKNLHVAIQKWKRVLEQGERTPQQISRTLKPIVENFDSDLDNILTSCIAELNGSTIFGSSVTPSDFQNKH